MHSLPVAQICIQLNGEAYCMPLSAPTITTLLTELELLHHKLAVEWNGEIIPRSCFDTTQLSEGDRLEIVHFVGGG
jgi:thiamine biosynthesis protein ThiS